MMKKLLSVVLTVCMVLSLTPMTALADTPDPNFLVIHAGSPAVPRTTLVEAVAIAVDGDTIQAQGDVNEELGFSGATITIDKNLTLDLNTHTVSLSAPYITVLSILASGSLTVKNGTLHVGTSGTIPAISVDGGSLALAEENPAEINVGAMKNGLSVAGGGDATVTNVSIYGEGGAAVSAVGVSADDADDFSHAAVLGDVDVTLGESPSPSGDGTYGAVAKDGAAIEVTGSISVNIDGVANQTDCVAAWATGTDSTIYVSGDVSATSKYGGAYGAAADNGGYMEVEGNASATGVGTAVNTSTGECEDMVAAAATRDSGSYVYVDDATATGEKNAFGCVVSGGYVSLSGNATVSATGDSAFACGAASYGSGGSTYTAGDTTVSASAQDSTAIGGYALAGGRVELWNLRVTSQGSAFGIVSDGVPQQGNASNVVAQAEVTYSGNALSAGAWAKVGGVARVNGYFTGEVGTPVIQVNNNTAPTHTTPDAYDTYTDDPNDGSVVYIVGLGKISGTVTDADGNPLSGVPVYVYEEHFSTVTDANGHYGIDPMPLYQPNCWATAEISEDVYRTINPFIRSMVRGSTTTVDFTNTSALFASTSDSSLLNDTATFGLAGTRAVSSDEDVVLAFANENNIRIISLGEGSATVTVKDNSDHKAYIAVTVDAQGYLTIGTITKYTASSSNDNNSHSGGTITTTPKATVSGSTATTTVTPTVSGGVATGSVTADQMNDALKKAQEAAGTNGTPNVAIQISGAFGVSSVATTIPHASIQALVSGGIGALTISGPTGSVSFGAAALKTISGASGNVTVTIAKTDSSALSDAAQALVGSHPVFTLSVTSGGNTISQFDGDVTVSVPYTPNSGEDTNAVVIYYIAADGTPTLVPNARYDAATGTVRFTTTHFSTYAVGYNKVSFTDVASGAWYADAVTFLSARGVTSGTGATTFSPNATLTRGQFVTMLLRAYGVAEVTNPTDNFVDAGNTYYTGYLAAAKKLGITSGVGGNKFVPDNAITRQEMFTLLYNSLKVLDKLPASTSSKTLADFTDSGSVASWASEAMTELVKAGTVTGSGGKLSPVGTTTRAEMAQVLYNLLGK